MPVTAIVPLKALAAAKTRLAPALSPADRRRLVAWMLARVLGACHGAPSLTGVLVVAGDEKAAQLARSAGAERVVVQAGRGLSAALALADTVTQNDAATLVVAADLPLVESGDLERIFDEGARPRGVVVAPTLDGGTGALLRRPPDVIGSAYGPQSAAAHLELAAAAAVPARRLDLPRLRVDVDTPEALRRLDLVDAHGLLHPPERLGS